MAAREGGDGRRVGLWGARGEWKFGTKITSHFQGQTHIVLTACLVVRLLVTISYRTCIDIFGRERGGMRKGDHDY